MSAGARPKLTLDDLDRFLDQPAETSRDGDLTPYLDAAAVLVAFDPDRLQPARGTEALDGERPFVRDRLVPLSELIDEGPQRGLWSLSFAERRESLRRLATRAAMRDALDANPDRPDTPVQRMFERVVDGEDVPLADLPRDELAALITVVGWLERIVEPLPDEAAVQSALVKSDLLAPMQRLAGRGFVDRQNPLAQIDAYAFDDAHPSVPLFIFGPGGIGKSALLAKFILDSVREKKATSVYIDLDRPTVRPDQPLTVLLEILKQIETHLNLPLIEIDPVLKEVTNAITRQESGRQSESYASYDDQKILEQLHSLLPYGPSFIIIDTFEEAQYMGPRVVLSLVDLVFALSQVGHLRVIIAGRALPKEYIERAFPGLPSEILASVGTWADEDPLIQSIPLPGRPINLGVLDEGPARDLLQNSIRLAGLAPLSESDADEVIGIVGRNPMCLNLAARLIRDQGVDKLRQSRSEFLTKLKAEKIQALLYGRILHHVHGDDVRKVAYPGLIVRRITPDVIRDVLATPCGLDLTPARSEHHIFDDLANEAALVERDPSDGSLRHRVDVRRAMLADLTDHVEPEVVKRIDEAAVAYYAAQSGAIARAEELYHRLRLREPESQLEHRWLPDPELGLRLKGAVEEVPPKQRLWLAGKLGITLASAVREEADQEAWENQAAQEADTLLRSGLADQALAVLRERSERLPRSLLYALEAEALRFREEFDEALAVARAGVDTASRAGAIDLALELLLKMVVIEESRGRLPEAETLLEEAAAVAASSHDALLRLRVDITRLRVQRQLYPEAWDQRRTLRREVLATITDDTLHTLRAHPVLLREVAAELGKEDARIAEAALRTLGVEVTTDEQANALAQALTKLNVTTPARQRPPIGLDEIIEQYEKANSDPDVIRRWVTNRLSTTGAQILSKTIGTSETGSDVLKSFRNYFRSGVAGTMKPLVKK